MKTGIKKILRVIVPKSVRFVIGSNIPKIFQMTTLVLQNIKPINNLVSIPDTYSFREISWNDKEKLKKFYDYTGAKAFDIKVPRRLNSSRCKGFAFIDRNSGDIVYMNWIHHQYEEYLNEFHIDVSEPFIFWDSAYCLPEHRHQGLHERMEQELINYSVRQGAKNFFMQIDLSNKKGNKYALSKGYKLLNTKCVISWPTFRVYRNLLSFLKNPFKKIN
ncbi:MAG TPA: hypothetical protein DCG75_17560 [Bacteroidales bacterium]|nr:hypothetical protein [Bacteroidales bacterium]